jgi:predicted DNA-binding antitoxin AbrB/MazE fold protein
MSTLYDRRLLVLLLKNYSHGRRSFTEGCRVSKMLITNRERWYEETTHIHKNIETKSAKPLQLHLDSQIHVPV